jgi:hypothetical protein
LQRKMVNHASNYTDGVGVWIRCGKFSTCD